MSLVEHTTSCHRLVAIDVKRFFHEKAFTLWACWDARGEAILRPGRTIAAKGARAAPLNGTHGPWRPLRGALVAPPDTLAPLSSCAPSLTFTSRCAHEAAQLLFLLLPCPAPTPLGLEDAHQRSLTRASFDLEGDPPTVAVRAAYSKHRRDDTLPLRLGTVSMLRSYLDPMLSVAKAFPMPRGTVGSRILRVDLEAAGIQYRDNSGRVADFHSLRHSFITMLANSGVHPSVAQRLARHSDINLTLSRYTHSTLERQSKTVESLPAISPEAEALRATGTDGRAALGSCLATQALSKATHQDQSRRPEAQVQSSGTVHRVREESALALIEANNGGEGGIRTLGPGYARTHGFQPCSFGRSDTSPSHSSKSYRRGRDPSTSRSFSVRTQSRPAAKRFAPAPEDRRKHVRPGWLCGRRRSVGHLPADASMVGAAGLSFPMGETVPEAKAAADRPSRGDCQDGVVRAPRSIFPVGAGGGVPSVAPMSGGHSSLTTGAGLVR